MTELNNERFFYCKLCRTASYSFECCEATTCNAMGCEKCRPIYEEAWKRIENRQVPQKVLDEWEKHRRDGYPQPPISIFDE